MHNKTQPLHAGPPYPIGPGRCSGAVQLSPYLTLACGVLAPLEAKLRICDPYHSMAQSRCLLTTRGKALLPER